MRKLTLYALAILLLAGSAALTAADDVHTDVGSIFIAASEEDSSVFERKILDDDYIGAGSNVNFSGKADDLYLMGKSTIFTGESTGALTAFAGSVEIDGKVAKNLHSGGNSVRVTGLVGETAFLAGQNIVIAEEAVLNGTLLSGANNLHIIGQLNDGLIAGAGEVIIDGPVNGDVTVKTGHLIITERGSIRGSLNYESSKELTAAEKGRVSGPIKYENSENYEWKEWKKFGIFVSALFFLGVCAGGLLLLLLPGIRSIYAADRDPALFGKTTLWGLIPLFLYPVAVIVTIPLFPLAIALALAAFPLLGLTTLMGLALGGQLLFRLFKWKNNSIHLQFLLAFGIYLVLSFIPFVRTAVFIGVAAAGSGLLLGSLFRTDFSGSSLTE